MKITLNKVTFFTYIIGLLFLQGCSTSGMMTARHNGKKYWNPGNCSQFQYYKNNSDKIHCVTDGKLNGTVLEPVDQQQLQNYYREQEINKQSSGGSRSSDTINCSRMGDLSFNKEIKTFTGMVCPLGWLQAY